MPKPRPKAPTPRARPDLLIYVLLLLATFAVYAEVRQLDFINYDDPAYVSENPHVRGGITTEGVVWALTSGDAANWFPVTRLSEMLDCQIFGLRSGWHHLINVLFHAMAVLFLFAFLHRATRAAWPSAFVASIFALHPLHVESVAWVAERKDALSAFFASLSLWAFVRYAEQREHRRGWYWAALVAFSMGLMSKPMIVTVPFLLLLLDIWPLRRTALQEKAPFFVLSAASAIVTYVAQRGSGAVAALVSVPFASRVGNALASCLIYIGKTLWPTDLAVFYPYPPHLPVWEPVLGGIAITGVTALVLRGLRMRPYLAVGWLWFLVTLAPVIGLVQVGSQSRADRYMYLPMVGLTIMAAWGAADAVSRWPRAKGAVVAAAAVCCAACAVATPLQLRYWRNSETLFRHAIQVTGGNYLAHYNLGVALSADPQRLPEAVREFEAALEIRPDYAEARNNLGVALSGMSERDAIPEYEEALRLAPASALAHNNLGNALSKIPGRRPEALHEYQTAIRLQPDYAEAHNNLGSVLQTLPDRLPDAISEFRTALRLKPAYANAHYNLANALAASPDGLEEAIREYQRAIENQPDLVEAHNNLAGVLSRVPGRLPDAIAEYRAALRIRPGFAEAHFNLGNLFSNMPGHLPDAIAEYRAALRIRPDYAEAHGNLGAALARTPGGLPDAITEFETALHTRPDLAETQYNLGVALMQIPGRSPEALAHLDAALRIKPNPQVQELVKRLRSGK
ncbi:MAG TPA: tetratricopeptide repeat protein [Bryobacteraceae bacterium]|nr:tetratricopeptide repeat protein [Bryobacteraceae bacterium]